MFLSFSLVFCRFGGWLGTTLYIHSTRRWVKARRRPSASRESEDERKGGEGAPFFAVSTPGLGGVCGVYQQARPVDGLRLAWAGPLPRSVYRLSDRGYGSPPRFCVWRRLRPPLRPSRRAYAGRETERADALCLHKCAATASASLSIKKRRVGWVEAAGVQSVGVCVGFDAGLYRWRWL